MGCPVFIYHPKLTLEKNVQGLSDKDWNCTVRYRYSFNGKEQDVEGMGGGGSTYDYGFRIYNPALGKFLSLDPLSSSYPFYTPYQFAGNKCIAAIDLDGLEEFVTINHTFKNSRGNVVVYKVDWKYVKDNDRTNKAAGTIYRFTANSNIPLGKHDGLDREYYKSVESKIETARAGDPDYRFAKQEHDKDQRNTEGSGIILSGVTISFTTGEGKTTPQVQETFDRTSPMIKEAVDNIAGYLVNVKDGAVEIKGFASLTDGDKESNDKLAGDRAASGKEFLLNYIKKNYKVSEEQLKEIKARITEVNESAAKTADPGKEQKIEISIKK